MLLLVDLQRGMCDDDGPAGRTGLAEQVKTRGVLDAAADALRAARAVSVGITHVRLAFDANYSNRTNRTERFGNHEETGRFRSDSLESEFRPEVAPEPGETIVAKGSVSPFASTGLLGQFLARGVTDLYIAGVATHLSVESAAREAADRGLRVTVLEDACAAPDPAIHEHCVTVSLPSFAAIGSTQAFAAALMQ